MATIAQTSERLLSLEGRGVAVTGGGRGIGRAVAILAAQLGASVTIGDRNEEGLADTIRIAAERGVSMKSAPLDVVDDDSVNEFVNRANAEVPLRGVVCSAGIGPVVSVLDMTRSAWQEVIDINLTGTFLVAQAAGRLMTAHGLGGSIIPVSSAAAVFGAASQVHYTASKGAINSMAKALARELGKANVRVNVISPGGIDTPLYWDRTVRATDVSQIPLPRLGKPEEVANLAAFLLADISEWITGQNFHINGGSHMP